MSRLEYLSDYFAHSDSPNRGAHHVSRRTTREECYRAHPANGRWGDENACQNAQLGGFSAGPTIGSLARNTEPVQPQMAGLNGTDAAHYASLSSEPIVMIQNVYKIYNQGENEVRALNNVSCMINAREFTAIVGPSGSGKSTLLHCLAGLDNVTSGNIFVAGAPLHQMRDKELTLFRRDKIGFVFQAFNLVSTLTAEENIKLPINLSKKKIDQAWFQQIVTSLAINERLDHYPSQLSGGQQQRVAVARAFLTRPALLVADEPTGNLDSRSSAEVLRLLRDSVDQLGQTVVMVTHDRRAAAIADRVLVVVDGQIVHDLYKPTEQQLAEVI